MIIILIDTFHEEICQIRIQRFLLFQNIGEAQPSHQNRLIIVTIIIARTMIIVTIIIVRTMIIIVTIIIVRTMIIIIIEVNH
jgi:hypothetical protein